MKRVSIGTVLSGILIFLGILVVPRGTLATILTPESFKLLASDSEDYRKFGFSVAMDGDKAIVGAPCDREELDLPGSAYIFSRQTDGTWIEIQKLTASDGYPDDFFGASVAIDGNIAVVGAPVHYTVGGFYHGAVYIFERQGDNTWTEVQKLTPTGGPIWAPWFALSFAISGDTLIAGSSFEDDERGSAYVFERQSDGTWIQVQRLFANDADTGDQFGLQVNALGDIAIVAAPYEDDYKGSAYVFKRQSDGTWIQVQKLTASDGLSNEYFGSSIAIGGDTAIVGANHGRVGDINLGSAYVFERQSDGTWVEVQKLAPSDSYPQVHNFGYSVALEGDTVIIGARTYSSAYVFRRQTDGSWAEMTKLVPCSRIANEAFGTSVAIGSGVAIVGAPWSAYGTGPGAAYVITLSHTGEIGVTPLLYNFGEVAVESMSTTILTVSNEGSDFITVCNMSLIDFNVNEDFSILSPLDLPLYLPPDGTVEVEIAFTPSVYGFYEPVSLNFFTNDPDERWISVSFLGTGVEEEPSPGEQIAEILDFIDASVSDGTLSGSGPGSSADHRLNALKNMIEATGDLIENGLIEYACQQLQDAYNRCDGEFPPPDFVQGPAAADLETMILDLMTDLGCPQG